MVKENKLKKREPLDVFVRYMRSAPGRNAAITVHGVVGRRFERGIPIAVSVTERKLLVDDREGKPIFEVVESEKDLDVVVKKQKPQQGIVNQKEIDKEEEEKKPYDPAVDLKRDLTKEEAYGLDRDEQIALLKARKVEFRSKDKQRDLVVRILKSNPGYNK